MLPGGRAPEFLRYDQDLLNITKHFFEREKLVASICHGIETLAAADVIRGRRVTTIARCRLDAEFSGATYVEEPLVIDGNLHCCRFKRGCSAWMKGVCARNGNDRRAADVSSIYPTSTAWRESVGAQMPVAGAEN